jgi:hypothetical protein
MTPTTKKALSALWLCRHRSWHARPGWRLRFWHQQLLRQSEWTVAAEYALKATDKFTVHPDCSVLRQLRATTTRSADFGGRCLEGWRNVDYQIVDNFYAKATVTTLDPKNDDDVTTGFFRLQRAF